MALVSFQAAGRHNIPVVTTKKRKKKGPVQLGANNFFNGM